MLHTLILICFLCGTCFWASVSPAAAKTNILVLHPYDHKLPASTRVEEAIRSRLIKEYGRDLDIYAEYLDRARFPGEQSERLIGQYIVEKYGSKDISLTIALGTASLQFALRQRDGLRAATPIIYCCVGSSIVPDLHTSNNVFGILSDYDVRRTVELARRLQPTARHVLVISGASQVDRAYETDARQMLEEYHPELSIQYLSGLPLDELLLTVAGVPSNTIILMVNLLVDGKGNPQVPQHVAGLIAKAASAPTYGIFHTLMGTGIVGGYMDTFENVGNATAELAIQVLAGAAPPPERIHQHSDRQFFVDARALDRWSLPRGNLPPSTMVEFDKASIWNTHRKEVTATLAAFSVVTLALIISLIQVRRRVRAEAYLRESEERLNFAAASGGIGLWQYDTGTSHLWSSEHCRAIFGLPPDTVLTTDFLLRCVHPEDRGIAAASIRAATYGPHAETLLEFRIVRPDGQIRSIQGRGHSTRDASGNTVRVSGVFRDLTAYRAVQREAKDLSRRILSIQDEERKRIAQELHDSTAQHLAAINLNLMSLASPRYSGEQRAYLFAEIRRSLTAAMNELRTFTYLLYPQELAHRGLQETLTNYIEGFSQRTGLVVALRTAENLDDLPQYLQQPLLRIVQESLANVHRHAAASRVSVKLQRRGNRVHLLIADNGVGLQGTLQLKGNEGMVLPLGVGIPGMAARARQIGGQLDVRSRATGTLVHASLPIDDDVHSPAAATSSAPSRNGAEAKSASAGRELDRAWRRIEPPHDRHEQQRSI